MDDKKVLAVLSAKPPRRYQKDGEGYFDAQARWLERWAEYKDAYCMAFCIVYPEAFPRAFYGVEMRWVDLSPIATPINPPITINVRKEVLAELVAAEEGAYEDAVHLKGADGDEPRPLEAHVHKVAQRYTSRLVIRTTAEAEDAYYAVCSGTFSLRSLACYNAAVRIATALEKYAKPETVKLFPISHIEKPDL